MELRQLEYFLAVADELHFGRAAVRLGMTQPPLSQQIRQLEEELGIQLFYRTNRRVELTNAGQAYAKEVRKILASLREAVQIAKRTASGDIGKINLGFVGSATYDLLPSIIRAYQERYPNVELALFEMPTPAQVDALQAGDIDVGVLRPPVSHPTVTVQAIQQDRCVAVLPIGHPCASLPHVEMASLKNEPFILVARAIWPGLYDSIVALCHAVGFSPTVRLEVKEVQTAVGLVAAGLGVSILPASTERIQARDVFYLPLASPSAPVIEMAVAWRNDRCSEVVKGFLKTVWDEIVGRV